MVRRSTCKEPITWFSIVSALQYIDCAQPVRACFLKVNAACTSITALRGSKRICFEHTRSKKFEAAEREGEQQKEKEAHT